MNPFIIYFFCHACSLFLFLYVSFVPVPTLVEIEMRDTLDR